MRALFDRDVRAVDAGAVAVPAGAGAAAFLALREVNVDAVLEQQ